MLLGSNTLYNLRISTSRLAGFFLKPLYLPSEFDLTYLRKSMRGARWFNVVVSFCEVLRLDASVRMVDVIAWKTVII